MLFIIMSVIVEQCGVAPIFAWELRHIHTDEDRDRVGGALAEWHATLRYDDSATSSWSEMDTYTSLTLSPALPVRYQRTGAITLATGKPELVIEDAMAWASDWEREVYRIDETDRFLRFHPFLFGKIFGVKK